MDPNQIHPVDFTQELFEQADHERRQEVVYFWDKFGRPSEIPVWIERVITALKQSTMAPLAYPGTEELKKFCREEYLRRMEAKAKKQTV